MAYGRAARRFVLGLIGCVSLPTLAHAWGARGHAVINQAAPALMESASGGFFQANKRHLSDLASVPDTHWKSTNYREEGPLHFFQVDNYRTSPLGPTLDRFVLTDLRTELGDAFVDRNGMAIWRVAQLFSHLVTALQVHDDVAAVQMAGVLGHYVGDLSQPMHNTSDYDGQSIGRRGIHYQFESALVNEVDVATLVDATLNSGGPQRGALDKPLPGGVTLSRAVRQLAIQEGNQAFADMADLASEFAVDDPDTEQLKTHFGPWLGRGAAHLAKLLDLAVQTAGVRLAAYDVGTVEAPDWLPLVGSGDAQTLGR